MVKQPVLDIDLGFVGVEEAGFDEGDAGHGGGSLPWQRAAGARAAC